MGKLLDFLFPENVRIRELERKMRIINEEYKKQFIPTVWKPGLEYSSETKHLFDEKYGMPKPINFPDGMIPKKSGTLKKTNLTSLYTYITN